MSWAVAGSFLELSRDNHSADFEWRFPVSDVEQLAGDLYALMSPLVPFAGWEWRSYLGRRDSSRDSDTLHLRLYRYPASRSPAPVVRYSLRARRGDEGPEEEVIGRGTTRGLDDYASDLHPWLRLSELRRRRERSAPPPGTFSIFVRLRIEPDTDPQSCSIDDCSALPREFNCSLDHNILSRAPVDSSCISEKSTLCTEVYDLTTSKEKV